MYHVTGTLLTVIFLYSLSYFFYLNKIFSLQFHRRLWNTVLAGSFLTAAAGGLILALQITYKWDVTFIKSILRWHVEFGIALAATGLMHLTWHYSYFKDLFGKKETTTPEPTGLTSRSRTDISINLFNVGFVSSSFQLLLLREIMNISGGYELIAGTFLGSWLIASAAGSAMAIKSSLNKVPKINLLFFSGPVVSVFLLMMLARLFLNPGETPSYLASIIFTFSVLLPFCFISGFTFIKLVSEAAGVKDLTAGRSFAVETAGGIVAGILISFISLASLNTYQTIILITVFGLTYTITSHFSLKRRSLMLFRIFVLVISSVIILSAPDRLFRQFLLRGVTVSGSVDTPYGNITKGVYGEEESIYYDHRLLYYSDDMIEREEDIHYPMLQLDDPENVLLISGSLNPHLAEINKYKAAKVVYVERDPALINAERIMDSLLIPEIIVENKDAYTYIKDTDEKFDAVILLLPPPSSLLLNRFYTFELFKDVKNVIKPGGVFSCAPGINPDYLNKESVYFFSSVYNSLKTAFNYVVPVSGNKLYLIASDSKISTSFCDLAERKKIVNLYVGPDYLADDLIALKTDQIMSAIDETVKLNHILTPVATFYFQAYNLSKNINEKIPSFILLAILFILPMLTVRRSNLLMYFSSSALAGYEIILLLILQSAVGNMYQVTGLILAGLMSGLAVGSGLRIPVLENLTFRVKSWLLVICYLAMYFAIKIIITADDKVVVTGALILSGFIPAAVTGNLFREFTGTGPGTSTTSSVYSADLAGSAIGCIVFSGFAVPIIGMRPSLLLFPVLILAGYLFTLFTRK
jgi:spermidine synthase